MSEPKRVTFETISTESSKNLAADATSATNEKTVRLELKLFEPNANAFPQFNFKKLCRAEKEKQKITLPNGFVDPFEENDHDAMKLAQEFERKYGNAYSGGDSRPSKGSLVVDKGSGYDENNGFIDDSEAYDELIPDEMDTDRGGFYINSGHLQFKKLPTKAPKRALSVSSEDESEKNDVSATVENGAINKKAKIIEKDKLMNNKEKKIETPKNKEKATVGPSDTTKDQPVASKEEKTTTVMNFLRAKRDALKSSSHINKGSKSTSSATSDDSSSSESDSSESSSDADPRNSEDDDFDRLNNKVPENKAIDNAATLNVLNKIPVNGVSSSNNIPPESDGKFVDNLSSHHRDMLTRLIDLAKNPKEIFFQSDTLDLLYKIIKAHQSDSKLQNQIYNYLEQLTPYSKQHLMNEVKEYAIKKSESDVRTKERMLQKKINHIMPSLKEKYDIDLKKAEEQRASYQGTEKPEHLFRNPRRKFQWNEDLRTSVNELITKWQSLYAQKQIRDLTIEQYTTSYITDKLVPMWPDGWMKSNDIQSHFMPKPKAKDLKNLKPTNELKPSKPLQSSTNASTSVPNVVDNVKDTAAIAFHVDKKKSHVAKEATKPIKNANDKPTHKTEKHPPITHPDRQAVSSLAPIQLDDLTNPKSVAVKAPVESLLSSVSATMSIKSKPITSSNGNAVNFSRQPDNQMGYVSPTKKASDHSISQLISCTPSNHSSIVSTLKHQMPHSAYESPTASSSHSISSKSTHGSSSKPKMDSQHRAQSSSNGSNNNNFLHNNNNNNKHSAARQLDTTMITPTIIDLSCDTDEGEPSAKKPKPHKHKHNKKSKESIGNSVALPNTAHLISQMHQASSAMNVTPSANDEVDHNQIIHDLKELSASNSSRKSFDSVLENQCEFKQHYNHYRASSPPYDRKQDHFF